MSVLLPARGLQPQERDQLGFLWEGCRRGSHPRGERPSGSGTRAETQQSDRVEPAAGSAGRGLLCTQGSREGLCCCGLWSAEWLLRVCHSRALSPARLAGQRQDTAGGGGAAGSSSPSPSPRRLSPLLRLLLSPSVVQEAPDSSVSPSHQGLLFISVACSGGVY